MSGAHSVTGVGATRMLVRHSPIVVPVTGRHRPGIGSRKDRPARLAVGSMAISAVFLRRRGSPESEPVGAAHTSTGIEG
ncbi:DUF6766 family protein [Streptomyces sp. NPDC015131]|uniref:DUF6766 family protein n=1 Tax=Streptomyces sp. NPDC015131 TaxID=3364941 RepID=UPI0036FCDF4F